jgi:uncharacterized membrane protein
VIYPLRATQDSEASQALLDTIERRFRPLANFSLLVLLVTGVVQMGEDSNYGGFFDFSNTWSKAILAKHIAFIAMIGIVVFLQFGLAPALERARLLARKTYLQDDVQKLRHRERRLGQINCLLAILVLLLTAIATAE